jgi:hypothetical protein
MRCFVALRDAELKENWTLKNGPKQSRTENYELQIAVSQRFGPLRSEMRK